MLAWGNKLQLPPPSEPGETAGEALGRSLDVQQGRWHAPGSLHTPQEALEQEPVKLFC